MKKVLFSIAAIAFIAMPALAQEKVIKKTKFSDNWFIQAQGGASYTISENFKDASVGDLITPTVAVSFGKHFTPIFGLRAQASGWESKSQYTYIDDTYRHKYFQAGLDGMFNLTNVFGEYDKDRFFNLYGMVGLAYVHGSSKDNVNLNVGSTNPSVGILKSNMIVPRVGFHADMALTDALSINLEVTGNLLEDRFNGVERAKAYDGMVTALAGITYHINKGFEVIDYIDPAELDALNNRINEQRALMNAKDGKISDLERQLAEKPKVIVEEVVAKEIEEDIVMNAVVVFKLGKADLQDNQEINIYNAARYFQENPDMHCVITGYADKATGNPTINQKISEKRAETVANIMVQKFGISRSRITTQASGDKDQPFQNDAWNRVVIFTAVKKK
ncbi:OmpA family protein [Dysgonomonas sp. 25]|uniref:OmpA family protein n=1 Tax=Dysgonomonas sp. 25 TaxID=2302933 RepID=UPI0013D16A7D|nr:OmpA family protein [Dysgonomonas sp. 25]NDV69411.1 OmpA family protein [Dysgonomonas sp. 25]